MSFAFLGTVAAKVGSFFANLANTALKWIGIIFAYRLGKRKAEQEQMEDAIETKDEQLEIFSKPATHRRGILERMRGRKRD